MRRLPCLKNYRGRADPLNGEFEIALASTWPKGFWFGDARDNFDGI
jgi:hypothetical protein